jgi:hypothetical protein
MNNLTRVTKYRESQKQQHRKDCALREKKNKKKHIIGRQTYIQWHTHTHTYTVNRKIEKKTKNRKEKFLLFVFFYFISHFQIVFPLFRSNIHTSQMSEKKEKKKNRKEKTKATFLYH